MEMIHLTDKNYDSHLSSVKGGIILFHKKLCPHCLNMTKVLEKFSAKEKQVLIMGIDSEENPQAMSAMDIERVPALVIVKNSNVVDKKIGLMNPRELTSWYESC
jgi:thioredoxin 1